MSIVYKIHKNILGEISSIKKDDGSGHTYYIPFDVSNSDYIEYLKWVEDGNTPEPAD